MSPLACPPQTPAIRLLAGHGPCVPSPSPVALSPPRVPRLRGISGFPSGRRLPQGQGLRPGATRSGSGEETEFVDTRIHWSSPDEGWIEGDVSRRGGRQSGDDAPASSGGVWPISRDLVMAIMEVEGSHYKVLRVSPSAGVDEVKLAYRRLSKLYHPDTTELPIELAEQKFVQLREAYSVLSSAEQRRLYDWKLASESTSRRGERFVWPYEVDQSQRGPGSRDPASLSSTRTRSSKVDENGNVPLSDGAMAALTFDIFAVLVSASVIAFALFFKN